MDEGEGDKKKQILDYLKSKDEVPTSELTGVLSINFYKLKLILDEMELKDKTIEHEDIGKFTYWKLKKEKKK